MHNIVVIDDNPYKMKDSIDSLSNIYEDITFYKFYSRNEALFFLRKYGHTIDLLILDWNFPIDDDDMPEIGMGEDILREMKRLKLNINTIICSSDEVLLENDYENVIGKILYDPFVSLTDTYKNILGVREEFEGKTECSVYDISPLVVRESHLPFDDIHDDEEIFQKYCAREIKKEKNRQKTLTRYQRKRSSDPWWKKN